MDDEVPASVLWSWAPVVDEVRPVWAEPGFDGWLERLAAADPDPLPAVADLHDPLLPGPARDPASPGVPGPDPSSAGSSAASSAADLTPSGRSGLAAAGEVVARAAESAPVESLVGWELGGIDPVGVSVPAAVALMVAAERAVAHFTAVKLRAVAAVAGPTPPSAGGRGDPVVDEFGFAWTEVAAALGVGEGTARGLVADAVGYRDRLPATFAALLAGSISVAKARRILTGIAGLSDAQAAAVEARVLPAAGARTYVEHSAAVHRAVTRVDPHGAARRREQRLTDAALVRHTHGDGVADLLVRNIDSLDAQLVWTAADTWARTGKAAGDPRSLDQLRVAALPDFARHYLTGHHSPLPTPTRDAQPAPAPAEAAEPAETAEAAVGCRPRPVPTRHAMPAVVTVVIGLPALVGRDPTRPGVIAGSGDPLPADAVADLLRAGARIRFALLDGHGQLAGISTRTHTPAALLRAFITLRDLTLRVPGGSATAIDGQDLDHLDPTGPTNPANLHAPSRGWHRAKTYRHWTVQANPDATITWTSRRTGRSYTTHPYNHHPDP